VFFGPQEQFNALTGQPSWASVLFEKGGNMINRLATPFIVFLFVSSLGLAQDNMKAFPPAEKGMVRHVLQLPVQTDEEALKVELIVGKMVQVDAHNRYFFGGKIEEETVKGWGYTLYRVPELGPMAGTLMAVDPNEPKVARFITLAGSPLLIRYNSRLPVVVYAPEDVEVHYRIWSAAKEIKTMGKG
jgi:ecotin